MSDVVVTRWIAASPPTVFAFFTDIERWTAWQGVGGNVDARPGGALCVIMPDAAAASGHFLEVVPPWRIVFTWGWEGNTIPIPPGSSVVTIELEPADNGTMVKLTTPDCSRARYESCTAAAGCTTWTDSPAVRSEKTQVQTATATSSGTDGTQRRVPLEVFKTAFDGPDPLLRHVRTGVRSPQTNGVIQRRLSTLKYEHLFRGVITDGDALDMEVHRFRIIYNTIRPHQALGDRTPSTADTGCDQQKPLD